MTRASCVALMVLAFIVMGVGGAISGHADFILGFLLAVVGGALFGYAFSLFRRLPRKLK